MYVCMPGCLHVYVCHNICMSYYMYICLCVLRLTVCTYACVYVSHGVSMCKRDEVVGHLLGLSAAPCRVKE